MSFNSGHSLFSEKTSFRDYPVLKFLMPGRSSTFSTLAPAGTIRVLLKKPTFAKISTRRASLLKRTSME